MTRYIFRLAVFIEKNIRKIIKNQASNIKVQSKSQNIIHLLSMNSSINPKGKLKVQKYLIKIYQSGRNVR